MSNTYKKTLPPGCNPVDFKYIGRPAKDQGDFGDDVGIADLACVDQFGKNSNKYYHLGVVQANTKWFTYFEWGRISGGKSWEGRTPENYWFVECSSEQEARTVFRKKCSEKNLRRLEQKEIAGVLIWVAKPKKDAYIVQSLATRERGLPDAYTIKDSSGLQKESKKEVKSVKPKKTHTYQSQVLELTRALVGGVQTYARAATAATGVTPTFDSITKVRDVYLPAALKRILELSKINPKNKKETDNEYEERSIEIQIADDQMKDISKLVAALVPRVIPRGKNAAREIILSSNKILEIQQDLDTYESNLKNEDFDVETQDTDIDPDKLLNAKIIWIDPNSTKGRWLHSVFMSMSNNRHHYISGQFVIKNIFEVERNDRDSRFIQSVNEIVSKNKAKTYNVFARLQPKNRTDLSDISDLASKANVFLGIHGTRAINIHPIISSNLRLPRALKGVHLSGANFGHGIYFATDFRKSYGYTGHSSSYYGGGGMIKGRGFFMFLCDVIMGDAYKATRTGSWSSAPDNKDSVAAYPDFMYSLVNDEHIIFDPNHQRIRYIIEGDLL